MTFKLESIKNEGIGKEQKITGEYVFNKNNKLSGDRTFAWFFGCEEHEDCTCDSQVCDYNPEEYCDNHCIKYPNGH